MVSYASTNALSMLGGDDYDTIQEEIAILDASVVHKTGNLAESINGVKTFVSDLVVNNATTDITTSSTFTVRDSTNTWLSLSDTAGILRAPNGGSTLDIQGALMRIDGSTAGGLNQLFFGAVNPFSSIEFRNTSMLFLNTDVVITTDSTNINARQMGISAVSNTTGDLSFILNKRTATGADLSSSGYRMIRENATGDFVLNRRTTSSGGIATTTAIQRISGLTSETFTMPTQTKVATTAFKVQNVAGTDRLLISPTNYLLQSAALSPLSIFSGTYSVYQAGTTLAITAGDTIAITAQNGSNISSNTGALRFWAPNLSFGFNDSFTTITDSLTFESNKDYNIGFNMDGTASGGYTIYDSTTNYLQIDPTTTNLNNTSINAVGRLYASSYSLGSSTGSNRRLVSMVMGCGVNEVTLPNVASGATASTNGVWAGGNSTTRTPAYGGFVPQFVTAQFSGGFTGGTSPTIRIEVWNGSTAPDSMIAATNYNSYTNGLVSFSSANAHSFVSPGTLGDGILYYVRYTIINGTGTAISASTKKAFVQVYGYQTL